METRTIQQCRLYVLVLNKMTRSAESGEIVAVSDDYHKLVEWYNSQFSEIPYNEDGWYKEFKKDSPLEWYNPVNNIGLNMTGYWVHGIHDEWIDIEELSLIQAKWFWV